MTTKISTSNLQTDAVQLLDAIATTANTAASVATLTYESANAASNLASSVTASVTVYATPDLLPLSGVSVGSQALVTSTNRLYIWSGTGWYSIALINTNPNITTGSDASYTLNTDGTPTVITLEANDPEGVPITWSYTVTSGSLEDTTVTNVDNVFTITPGETAATFDLTFTASDGINTDTSTSAFTLSFGPDWSVATLLHTLNNPNAYGTSVDDYFGRSVAISGNYTIVGSFFEDDAGGTNSGKAYIFNVETGTLVHTLNNPNAYGTSASDQFGDLVAIDGNYAIVSGWNEDDAGGTSSGKVYVFNVTTGALVHTLDNPNAYGTSVDDYFGRSIAISGNYVIVGAVWEDIGGDYSGAAYIFDVTTGSLVHTLANPNAYGTSVEDLFGRSVGVSGNYAIVGANGEDDAGGNSSGKAYIFNVTTGALVHTLDNPNAYGTSAGDAFGLSVAISGNYAIVGAFGEDDAGGNSSGKAYIFNVTTGALLFTLDNPNAYGTSDGDNFGFAVAIDGNYAIVGAYQEDDAGGTLSGKAYIYNVTTGSLVHTLDNPNAYDTSANDGSSYSVGISGNYAIVNAAYEKDAGGTNSGKAYIFQAG